MRIRRTIIVPTILAISTVTATAAGVVAPLVLSAAPTVSVADSTSPTPDFYFHA